MRLATVIALLSSFVAVSAAAAELRYSVVMSGTTKGTFVVADIGAGQRRTTLKYDDRGRGPDLVAITRYDHGFPQSVAVDGVNYAKRPVTERFTVNGARAQWSSSADTGDAPAAGFYLPSESTAEDMAALARAVLRAAQHTLTLLPSGQARIREAAKRTVTANGRRESVALYFISGLDLQPSPIWLDARQELFASGGTWLGVVREGFEATLPELLTAQSDAVAADARAATRTMARRPRALVIRNARLFDAEQRTLRPATSVLVRGEKIEAVGASSDVAAPKDAEVIDAAGKVLLPGMWDMHVHVLDQAEGALQLLAGITTVRDLGNDPDALDRITTQFDDGTLPGARVLEAGLIDRRGELAAPIGKLVGTVAEMQKAVNAYADRGYRQVKLYSSLSRDLLAAGIAAVRARGMRVSGHVPAGMTMREVVLAGYDEVQHANFWMLNFMSPEINAKTNSPVRFSAVYEHGREIDLQSTEVRSFVALLKEHNTVVDPTLVTFENMFRGWRGEQAAWLAPWAAQLPATSLRGGRGGGRASTPEQRAAYSESFARMQQLLKMMHDAGIRVVAGTDGGALLYSRELELYVEAGIPAADVLYIATLGAARVMSEDANSGSIAPGKRADMVLIDGNPLERIGDVRHTVLTIKNGTIYQAAALAQACGLTPAHPTGDKE
ncbi:MAG: amidohydrolase family protein [Steroidobacteraceae bacterium]